jgi:hypothetical protein
MHRTGRAAGAAAAASLLLASGCVSEKPAELGSVFTPPSHSWLSLPLPKRTDAPRKACPVRLGTVTDSVPDPHVLGNIGGRPIHAADLDAWIRSGFRALGHDARLTLVDGAAEDAAVTVSLEVLKAYTLSLTTEKSTNLVLRARFTSHGAADTEQIYRGVDTAVNWNSGQGETQTSFDRALAQVLEQLDRDMVARCTAGEAG